MKQILVAMPTYSGNLPIAVVSRLLAIKTPKGFKINFVFVDRVLIDKARNGIAKVAMDEKQDYLFFWDDDQLPDTDILEKMVKLDKDIVGCPIPCRRGGKWIAVFDKDGDKLEHIHKTQEVGGIGMANTLIKVGVIKKMFKQWKQLFDFEVIRNNKGIYVEYGEDITFCRRAKDMGFKIWCDATIKSIHIGDPVGYWYEDGEYKQKIL